jgi:transcriptional regulator with XRE-family HTH domain
MPVPTSKISSDLSSDLEKRSRNQDNFFYRVKLAREKVGISQNELAKKLGVSTNTIQSWEKNVYPKADKTLQLSSILDCSLNWLLMGEGDQGEPSSEDKKVPIDNIRDVQHDPIIREFDDKEFALEINQALISVEKTSLKEFYKLGGYIKALSESGIEMRTEPGRSLDHQNDPDFWDGTERRSGEDRRKSVSEELPPTQKK